MTLNLTNAGLNVLLRALAGDNIVFTKAQIGNGEAQAPATADALSNPLLDLPIQAIDVSETNATLQTKFNNAEVEAGFRHTETGIFVQNQDDSSAEILYAYGTQPESTADYIAASGDSILETQMDFLVFVGESTNISAIISESLVYASAAELKSHVDNTENPHKVTSQQVGLGNVPNVTTNDQKPTYTEATALVGLTSGEKLSVAFGKIAKAVTDLITHITNKNNPHEVKANQIGAADEVHEHSATEITKGILGVPRGGTGKGSWTANRLPYPSSASAFSQLQFPSAARSALYQDTSGAPYWAQSAIAGKYTGQGRTGSSSPNSLTFSDGCPKLIIIKQRGMIRYGLLFISESFSSGFVVLTDTGTTSLTVSVSTSGKSATVSWYYNSQESHPANQLDGLGSVYDYVAIM